MTPPASIGSLDLYAEWVKRGRHHIDQVRRGKAVAVDEIALAPPRRGASSQLAPGV